MKMTIEWYYHRKGWTSCKRADAFLEGVDVTVRETVNAGKERFGPGDLARIFGQAGRVVVAKGRKVLTFNMKTTDISDPDFQKAVIGPSGYLRAPALRKGKTMLVGFNEDAYGDSFS